MKRKETNKQTNARNTRKLMETYGNAGDPMKFKETPGNARKCNETEERKCKIEQGSARNRKEMQGPKLPKETSRNCFL